jgi:alpha-tubulin suppressor-like RCC1 family protein
MKIFGAALLTSLIVAGSLAGVPAGSDAAAAAPAFGDVPSGAYFEDAVGWLADQTITTGTSATTFSPDDPVTRGQLAAFLSRFAQDSGDPGAHGFADVPGGVYYDGPVSFLVERAITTGTSATTYSPEDVLTRAQMATFLWRFSNEPATGATMPFTDVSVGTYYYDAVRWLADKGITTGTSPITFSPDDVVSRAQMATFLWRLAGEPAIGELGLNRVDTSAAVIADEDDVSFTTLSVNGPSEIEWTGDNEPGVGDIVVMDVTAETPDAFLGKVTSVNGNTVMTEPATLQEAIPEGEFDVSVDLQEEGLGSQGLSLQAALSDAFENAEFECGAGAEVVVEAGVSVSPRMTLSGSWSPGQGVEAAIGLSVTLDASLTATVAGAVECSATVSVDGPKLKAIRFWVGPYPVWIEPELSFEGEVYANFEASATAGWTYTETLGVEVGFSDGRWGIEYDTLGNGPGVQPVLDIDADAVLGIELRPRLDLLVYGRVGPYLTLGPFFELNAQYDTPWWSLDAGLRARAGAKFDLWFWEEEVEFGEVDLFRFTLAEAADDRPADFVSTTTAETLASDAGGRHACAILANRTIGCWGQNTSGQLGAGSGPSNTPRIVDPISDADPIGISAGASHTCAVFADGTIECWGENADGQLGDGTFTRRTRPVRAVGISNARTVEVGADVSCAILGDFSVKCWGNNSAGSLGDGTTVDRSTPVVVSGIDLATDLTVGTFHACAVLADKTAQCWGGNGLDQLGNDPAPAFSATPVPVQGLDDAVAISAGFGHTCVVKSAGGVSCWGKNSDGQLGDGSSTDRDFPTPVVGIGTAVDIGVGYEHSCAVMADGTTRCWGDNLQSQLTSASANTKEQTPVASTDVVDAAAISGGRAFTCVQTASGKTRCWGLGIFSQLGNGADLTSATPVTVVNPQ